MTLFYLNSFSFLNGKEVGKTGPKRKLELSELLSVQSSIKKGALSMKTLSTDDVKVEIQKTILKKNGLNSHANLDTFAPISSKTVSKYISQMQAKEVQGKIQATSRVDPFNDIKNCMAKAAGMSAINKIVDQQHFHSDDEVGVFLNGWGKNAALPKLVVCEVSNKWLRDHNLSASKSEDPNQQRVVHIGTTQQPSTGDLTCIYCRIVDSNFPDAFSKRQPAVRKPLIFCLNEIRHVYAVLANPLVTEVVISEYIGIYIISKAIAERQELCIERDIKCAIYGQNAGQIFADGSTPDTPVALVEDEINAIKAKHKFACLLRDGCDGQIRAGKQITAYNKAKGRNIITGKYSGGCSMVESMNDGGHGHDGIHRLFESKDFKMRPYDDPASSRYVALKSFLQKYLTPASFKTYWAFLCAFEPYIITACSPIVLKSAAKQSGFEGDSINVRRIMSYNTEFAKLSDEKAEEVIGIILTVLVPFFTNNQWIPETLYPELFPVDSGFDFTLSTRSGTPLNDLTTNRQRFIVDNSDQWQALLAAREAASLAADHEIAQRRLLREADIASKPKLFRSCSHLGCTSIIDITTPSLRKINDATWKKCQGNHCRIWVCPIHFDEIKQHENICSKCKV